MDPPCGCFREFLYLVLCQLIVDSSFQSTGTMLCFTLLSVNEVIRCKHNLNYNHIILPSLIRHQFSTVGFNVVAYFPSRNVYRTYSLITHYRKQFYHPHPKYTRVLTFNNYNFFFFFKLYFVCLCVYLCMYGGQRTTLRSQFSPHEILGWNSCLSGLAAFL